MTADRRGFALIASLWATTLLTTLALAIALDRRVERRSTQNFVDEARSRAAARGGIEHARSLLSRLARRDMVEGGGAIDPWGTVPLLRDSVTLGDAWYTLELEDAGARVHLNRADEEALGRLFIALRIDARAADSLAQTIADWRDADHAHRARGAERDAYLRAGMPLPPANRPFGSVSELRRVRGIDAELYERIAPFVTVDGSGRISAHSAPPEVLLSLPGMTPEAVTSLLRMRRDGRRLGHVAELAAGLPEDARLELLRHLPALVGRLALETSEVVARSTGGVRGSPVRSHADVLFVRSADSALAMEAHYR